MKVALLHYWLTNMRGGEKVLREIASLFPEAELFTHAFIGAKMPDFTGRRVFESFIAKLPAGRSHPQLYLPLMPAASRRLKLEGYDLIVSSESGPIKGIAKPAGARHVCYCHSPMRYVWDLYDEYYRNASWPARLSMRLFRSFMQRADLESAESADEFIANSKFVAERIKRIYHRDSEVIHPPVDVEYFSGASQGEEPDFCREPFYLFVGELRAYKRPALAVEACLRLNRRLVVIGNGAMRKELLGRCAGSKKVFFPGGIGQEQLRFAYARAKALIFPGVEDFGIVPVEAQAAGTPVIALGEGGALETVKEGETGVFFKGGEIEDLCAAIEEFEARSWSRERCLQNARSFDVSVFREKISRKLLPL